jgi:hypothetical protein
VPFAMPRPDIRVGSQGAEGRAAGFSPHQGLDSPAGQHVPLIQGADASPWHGDPGPGLAKEMYAFSFALRGRSTPSPLPCEEEA